MSTTITTATGITEEHPYFEAFTDEERAAAASYIEEIAGIPDMFDAFIDDAYTDVAAGIRAEMTTADIFRFFVSHKQSAEKWIEGAVDLRRAVEKPSEDFLLYANGEIRKAREALGGLAGHALNEITGTRRA